MGPLGKIDEKTSRRYVIVSPCRDEEAFMRQTLDSVLAQSVPPSAWVIVDDGSTDRSPEILAEYAARHPSLKILRRENRGRRAVGPGVVEAFYAGLDTVDLDDFDYVCKLDLDLELPPTYFERMLEEMESEPRLGNFSGKAYLREEDGRLITERFGDENAIGAAKFYRVAAFRSIGGFVREVGWDGIDGHMCRMKGWVARSEDLPEIRFIHLRRMGSSQKSIWAGRARWGFGKYYMGSALYYVAAVAFYRMFDKPYALGGLAILFGFLRAMLTRAPRFEYPEFRRHLRRYELQSLVYGKRRAADRYHERIRRAYERQGAGDPDSARARAPVRKRILGVSSGGGHWVELIRLAPAFQGHDVAFATVDEAYRGEAGPARFYTVQDVTRWDTWRCASTLAKLAWILLRERPDVVVSTGALPGYFSLRLARWFGARTVWVDSIANVKELSLSGRRVGAYADLWLTQWPHLAGPDGPSYRGSVL
jgi:glycosyltransferase involved in cell wall biosynthesis